jgi:hypothetical protein
MNNMRYKLFLLVACLSACFVIFSKSGSDKKQSINPILGDTSFEKAFGKKPTAEVSNELRIATHLAYVENLLREKELPHLSATVKEKRLHALNLLHQYWEKGVFPENLDYPGERKPCFIDKNGRICAVGFLVEQTASREAAERINEKYQYEELLAMNDPLLDDWVAANGFTKEECAMIQPTYGDPVGNPSYTANKITPAYGISSSIAGGISLSLNTINSIQISRGSAGKTVPLLGLITGAGQIALGLSNMPKQHTNGFGAVYTNESQKTLSFINIGLGTTSIILSTWNLLANRKPKEKPVAWNIYSYPVQGNNTCVGLSMTKRL